MIFTKQAIKAKSGTIYAPGKDNVAAEGYNDRADYRIYKLCSNYDGKVRGGISKTWRYIAKDLTLEQAKKMLENKYQKG